MANECPHCARWADAFARLAVQATEAGALIRSLLKTLNDQAINRQVEAAERLLAEAKPVNHWIN